MTQILAGPVQLSSRCAASTARYGGGGGASVTKVVILLQGSGVECCFGCFGCCFGCDKVVGLWYGRVWGLESHVVMPMLIPVHDPTLTGHVCCSDCCTLHMAGGLGHLLYFFPDLPFA